MMIPISVIVMTKNEEKNIKKCLETITEFSQIFVVDSNSEDATHEIAKQFDIEFINFTWNGKYPKKKQWCLDNLKFKNEWVLFLDADEEVTEGFKENVLKIIERDNSYNGFFAKYNYVFLNRVLKFGYKIQKLILFKHSKGYFEEQNDLAVNNMWEVEGHYQPIIEGKVGVIRTPILHNDNANLYDFFERHNRYSDWEAHIRNIKKNKIIESQTFIRKISKIIFLKIPFRGFVVFMHAYFFKLGFLDGWPGFHYAAARAFYYWQISAKQYELNMLKK